MMLPSSETPRSVHTLYAVGSQPVFDNTKAGHSSINHSFPVSSLNTTKSLRKRLRCNWKGCSFTAASPHGSRYVLLPQDFGHLILILCGLPSQHLLQHRQCPKQDCTCEFDNEKEKSRHVWKRHRKWAAVNNYPSIGGQCDICGKVYERADYVSRHKREKHI